MALDYLEQYCCEMEDRVAVQVVAVVVDFLLGVFCNTGHVFRPRLMSPISEFVLNTRDFPLR